MLPEFYVGGALLSWSVMGQPLALCLGPWSGFLDDSTLELCYRGYWLSWNLVYAGLAFFCRHVFGAAGGRVRGGLFWLSWLPGLLAWSLIAVWGTSLGPWPEAVCNLTCGIGFGWAGAEALLYWSKLRRREVVGLADPVVVNRFLLWGSCCAATSPIAFWVFALAIQGQGLGSGYAPAEFATSAGGVVNGVIWMFTFVPPTRYKDAIRARAARRGVVASSTG
jgi:hypothetical protein